MTLLTDPPKPARRPHSRQVQSPISIQARRAGLPCRKRWRSARTRARVRAVLPATGPGFNRIPASGRGVVIIDVGGETSCEGGNDEAEKGEGDVEGVVEEVAACEL